MSRGCTFAPESYFTAGWQPVQCCSAPTKYLVVVYTSQAAYILYDEKCREHGCIHFAYGEFWEVPGAWLHTFYMMKSASSLYKITVPRSCIETVWRFSSIPYCCFDVKSSCDQCYNATADRLTLRVDVRLVLRTICSNYQIKKYHFKK